MTTITISQLASASPLQDGYYIPVDTGTYTGHIQGSDIKAYVTGAQLSNISVTSGVFSTIGASSITTGSLVSSTSVNTGTLSTSGDASVGGNLSLTGGNLSLNGYGNVTSSQWNKFSLVNTGVSAVGHLGFDSNGLVSTTNATFLSPNWTANDTSKKAFLYAQNISTGRHEFKTASTSALSPSIVWTSGVTIDETGLQATAIGASNPGTAIFTGLTTTGTTTLGQTNASAINNTPIGTFGPSTGAFTAITAGTINIAALNATVVGNVTPAAGTFTTLSASSVSGNGSGLTSLNAGNFGSGVLPGTYGGTGVNNGSNTLTISGTSYINQGVRTSDGPTFAGVTVPSISHSGSNGSGDIGASGSTFATVYATTFSGVANTAKYADLAENYQSDVDYEFGTVLVFGDDTEVTISTTANDSRVAGVVSENPAYLMNTDLDGIPLALQGRVPCKVTGKVRRGDLMVTSSIPGVAMTNNNPAIGTVIGKALGNYSDDGVGIIEVVVGRV